MVPYYLFRGYRMWGELPWQGDETSHKRSVFLSISAEPKKKQSL